jgi:hypothetical protein
MNPPTIRKPIPLWLIKYKNLLITAVIVVPVGITISTMYFISQPYTQVDTPPALDADAVVQDAQAEAIVFEQQMKVYLDGGSEPGEIHRILSVKAEEIRDHVDKSVRNKSNSCYRKKKTVCFDTLEIGVEKEIQEAALSYKTDNYLSALMKYKAIQLARNGVPTQDIRPSTFKVLRSRVQESRQLQAKTSVETQSTEVLIQANEEAEDDYEQ